MRQRLLKANYYSRFCAENPTYWSAKNKEKWQHAFLDLGIIWKWAKGKAGLQRANRLQANRRDGVISDRPGWPSEGEHPDVPLLVKVFQASRACDGQARCALLDQTLLCCLTPLIVKSSWALLSWWCWKASFNRSFLMQNFQRIQGLTLSSSSECMFPLLSQKNQIGAGPETNGESMRAITAEQMPRVLRLLGNCGSTSANA